MFLARFRVLSSLLDFFGEVPCALLVFWIYLGIFRRGLLIFEYFAGSTSILIFLQGFMCSAS